MAKKITKTGKSKVAPKQVVKAVKGKRPVGGALMPKGKRPAAAVVQTVPVRKIEPSHIHTNKPEAVRVGNATLPRGGRAPHGIVQARAGTGKTFTLVMGVANCYRDEKLQDSWTFKRGKQDAQPATLWGKVEKQIGAKVVPSSQQKEVWNFMAKEKPRTICYVAFNNSIVDEFSTRYAWLVATLDQLGVKLSFSTIHSLGNAACREHYRLRGWKAISQYRVSDLLAAHWQVDLREVWKERAEEIDAIKELVGLCKLTLAGRYQVETSEQVPVTDERLDQLATHYGILLNEKRESIFNDVRTLLRQCRTVPNDGTGRIDFNDMVWLPVVENLKVECYDLLLVDEAQDLNRCQQELVLKAGKRIILVGDERQAIYGFAGADTDSIDRMAGLLNNGLVDPWNNRPSLKQVEELRLTVTRRCGRAIVAEAQKFVPDFEAHESVGPGKVSRINIEELSYDGDLTGRSTPEEAMAAPSYSLGESDMVLCRTNAPLVSLAFKMLKAGKRVNIKGRDIGQGLKAFIKKSKAKDPGEFLTWLDKFQQTESEKIQKRRNPDADALVTLEDKCSCLRVFCEGAFDLKGIYKSIDNVFQGKICPKCNKSFDEGVKRCYDCKGELEKPQGTLCSSVHRAKGLEAKRVFILRPDLMPHKMAKSVWEKGQEANLQYVAITRAIEELVYVDGKVKEEAEEAGE